MPRDLRRRVLIEDIAPQVDGGLHPAKRVLGDTITLSCDLVADGHDALAGAVHYRPVDATEWRRAELVPEGNDRWAARVALGAIGLWEFRVEAWVDVFATWRRGTAKKIEAGRDVASELAGGALLLREAAGRAARTEAMLLEDAAKRLTYAAQSVKQRFSAATDPSVTVLMARYPDPRDATRSDRSFPIEVDPPLARFSSWYEMFPRSTGAAGKHGTLRDCARRLPYVQAMGFDVLYLPPIHPIGTSFRKGPNNMLDAGPEDVGSPWAIGSAEGGHKSVHPALGTLEDLRALVDDARGRGIEVALDIAFQASPDHPYVNEHPEWFRKRADGSIQYAENPPKKYEDVYPFDFECEAWEALWAELVGVFLFWCDQGVRVFRVDNPHTKSVRFWDYCLKEVKRRHPDVIFLAEAFTRPKVMYALAKAGFTQSYTYFTWRHTREELTAYLTEITAPPVSDFYRPNFWTNTPDILPEHLQFGGRPTFIQRLVLAATLSSNYGVYGPAFELMEHTARAGSEEYEDNEKYQLRAWDIDREDSLKEILTLVNRIRRENPALQANGITFHPSTNEHLLCFSKESLDGQNVVLVVVNLDAHHVQSGHLELKLAALGVPEGESFQVHDLLAEARYLWQGGRNFVEIDPGMMPAAIFRIRRKVRTEQDFEYFL